MAEIDPTSFLSGANAEFIAELYSSFLDNPAAVDDSWRRFFGEVGDDRPGLETERAGPPWARPPLHGNGAAAQPAPLDAGTVRQAAADSIRALNLTRAYRVRGHLEADLDPLGLEQRGYQPELDYRSYGFSEADLDREIFINGLFGRERASLRDIIGILRLTYCGRIGVEYMHIQVPAERLWIQQKFEHRAAIAGGRPGLTNAARREVLRILTEAEAFERFLDRRAIPEPSALASKAPNR